MTKGEFLDWIAQKMELTKEQLYTVGVGGVEVYLREEWGMVLTNKQRAGISQKLDAYIGVEGRRFEFVPEISQYRWRDITTGRFVAPPKGWSYKGRRL